MIYLFIFGDKSFNFSGKTIYFSFQVKEEDGMIYLFIFGDKSFNFSGKTIYFSFQVKEEDDKDIYIYILQWI